MSYLACYEKMLWSGCCDWVDVFEVAAIAKHCGMAATNESWRKVVLSLVQQVLEEGLMEIGDLGFEKWPLSNADALARVRSSWKEGARPPGISEIGWLQSTPRGLAKGRAVMDLWLHPRDPLDTLVMQAERYGFLDANDVSFIAVGPGKRECDYPSAITDLIRAAVSSGHAECGNYSSGRFMPWRDSLDECVHRFKLLDAKGGVFYTEFCMENTTKGRVRAVSLLADWFDNHRLPS